MNEKNGFTLIELLAVIAILAILVIIAVPNIISMYNNSKKQIFLNEAQTVATTSIRKYLTENMYEVEQSNVYCKSKTDEKSPIELTGGKKYYYVEFETGGEIKKLIFWDNKKYIKYISNGTRDVNDLTIDEIVEQDNTDMNCENVLEKTNSIIKPDKNYVVNYNVTTSMNKIEMTAIIPESATSNLNEIKYVLYKAITNRPKGTSEINYTKVKETIVNNKSENFKFNYSEEVNDFTCLFVYYKIEAFTVDGYKISESTDDYEYCFVAGTKVKTESGFKNIEDVKVGEKVYSYNLETNELELKKVLGTITSTTKDTYTLTIGNKKVEMSPKHQIYIVDKGWTRAYDVKKGDKMLSSNKEVIEIKDIKYKVYDTPIKTYNLTIEGNSNYFVTDIQVLVHNAASLSC